MPEPMRFALVGAGGIAQSYAQALEDCGFAKLSAVVDVRPETARALAERARCASFDSHAALVESGHSFDAVIVSTPPNSHEEITTFFLERKIPVLCEKPFTLDSASAHRMAEAARRTGVQLTMAAKFRFVEDVIRAKSIVASGILGEIILFENAFTSRVAMNARWNADPTISGGGVLIDNGPHSVDLMRYFLGPLSDVQVVTGKQVQGLTVEDTALIFVRSESNVMGRIDLSWSINKELDSYIKIYGSHGTISVGWKESKYRQSTCTDWVVFGNGYNKVQAFRSQLENFTRSLRGEEKLLITPDDAIASVEVIEAAYRAVRDEHWTHVQPTATTTAQAVGRNGAGHQHAGTGSR